MKTYYFIPVIVFGGQPRHKAKYDSLTDFRRIFTKNADRICATHLLYLSDLVIQDGKIIKNRRNEILGKIGAKGTNLLIAYYDGAVVEHHSAKRLFWSMTDE